MKGPENEALKIINKIKEKSEFSKFAKKYSVGPSKNNGGNLGWFGPGQMVKEFEQATFKLEKGMITTKPVKTFEKHQDTNGGQQHQQKPVKITSGSRNDHI